MVMATHIGVWTEGDLADLPEDGVRREVLEGALIVNASPSGRHQMFAGRLARLIEDAAPPGLVVVETLGVRGSGVSVLIPDIVVADRASVLAAESGIVDSASVVLVVEIVSPSSQSMDRLTKPALYASAGIGSFWRVELDDGPAAHTYRLVDGTYAPTGIARPGQPLRVDMPFEIAVEVADLG